ncbi:MAG TPA: hypothetical protein VMB46_03170 [Methanomassiliicoccales archaeon]|nr:hypothetical protein [Methanomassiliicoccales archaeon]
MIPKNKRENAKTRYDAKKPVVSFRVSEEERKRLDNLCAAGRTLRELVLIGAGMAEAAQTNNKRIEEQERDAIEVEAIQRALGGVILGRCIRCGKPIRWNLLNPKEIQQVSAAVEKMRYFHESCRRD